MYIWESISFLYNILFSTGRYIWRYNIHVYNSFQILTVHLNLYLIPAAIFSPSTIEEGTIGSPHSLQVLLPRRSSNSLSPTTYLLSDKMSISSLSLSAPASLVLINLNDVHYNDFLCKLHDFMHARLKQIPHDCI